jgi:hypothetical protein
MSYIMLYKKCTLYRIVHNVQALAWTSYSMENLQKNIPLYARKLHVLWLERLRESMSPHTPHVFV